MPKASRLLLAKSQIDSFFSVAQQKVYAKAHLATVLEQNRQTWHLNNGTRTEDFITFLKKTGKLQSCKIRSEAYGQELTRYTWGPATNYQIALSIKPRSYLCHATALSLHGLSKENRKWIYLNSEQSPKPSPTAPLTQDSIEVAFSRQQRQSNLLYTHRTASITVISGKSTQRLGVEEMAGPNSETLAVTNLERTLIDVVVRPAYAGGISKVLEAYRGASGRLIVDQLLHILKKLNYIYPYHQAIGFLMQRSGYPEPSYAKLCTLGLKYDFYLTHGMHLPSYSKEWRLYYPTDFENN